MYSHRHLASSRQLGFTLIEVMIVVAIVAILSMVAYPAYTDYVIRGNIPVATAGLATKQVQMEQFFQDRRTYVGGETQFYLGRRYRLHVRATREVPASVKLAGGRIGVVAPVDDPAAIRRRLRQWYRAKAVDYFGRRLAVIVADLDWLDTTPPMKLVPMKTQWGSCSPTGAIHLNPALIRAPRHCIDYVLTHELCHLREHNHSKRFYALLENHLPQWAETKAELDRLAELLLTE